MQKCILRLILETGLYDEMTDCLLTFPDRELEFMGLSVQAHTRDLGEISEQVSGFKQKMMIEINTNSEESVGILRHIKNQLTEARFESQLIHLLDL